MTEAKMRPGGGPPECTDVWSNVIHARYISSLASPSSTDSIKRNHKNVATMHITKQNTASPPLDTAKLATQHGQCHKRLFMFDYDGTLTPVVEDPAAAVPSKHLHETIHKLAADPENAVWLISGRDRDFLAKHWGHIPELGLSAEHGCFKRPPQSTTWEHLAEDLDMSWQPEAHRVFDRIGAQGPGSWIEQKSVALSWHYRQVETTLGASLAKRAMKELEATVVPKHDVEVMAGKMVVEIRPKMLNKGAIVTDLLENYEKKPEFIMCAGDDHPDEGE